MKNVLIFGNLNENKQNIVFFINNYIKKSYYLVLLLSQNIKLAFLYSNKQMFVKK